MSNKIATVVVLAAVLGGLALSAQGKYMRKQLQPDFFIPAKDQFNQPEKLPPLANEPASMAEAQKTATSDVNNNQENTETGTPDYQTKFDKYNQDIADLSKNGEMPKNAELEADLAEMNSDDQKPVVTKETSKSEVSRDFEQIVDEITADN